MAQYLSHNKTYMFIIFTTLIHSTTPQLVLDVKVHYFTFKTH